MTVDPPGPPPSTGSVGQVRLEPRGVDHRDSIVLLQAFYEEQLGRYSVADSVDLLPADYTPPHGIFVVLYDGGRPVGCGGCRWHDRPTATVEIKKTYLIPAARGRGLGRLLLRNLEEQAVDWGAEQVVLETGIRNTAAIELFNRCGYRPATRYVRGRDPEINRAFAKSLASRRGLASRDEQ